MNVVSNFVLKPILFVICGFVMWLSYITITSSLLQLDEKKLDNRDLDEDWMYISVPVEDGNGYLKVLERKGTGKEDPIVILLHGYPESARITWSEVIPHLRSNFHIIAPDQRGYNNSYSPPEIEQYGIESLVKDIEDVVNYIRREDSYRKIFIVGHDWGGAIAWRLSLMKPELVDKLVIVNQPHPKTFEDNFRITNLEQLRKCWHMFFFQIPILPEFISSLRDYDTLIGGLVDSSNPKSFTNHHIHQFKSLWTKSLTTMTNWYRSMIPIFFNFEKVEYSYFVKTPTLIIWGEKDQFFQKEMAELSLEWCEKGKLITLHDSTHWVSHEKTSELAEFINEFFEQL